MRTLTILYDADCGLCRRIKDWLQTQTKYIDLDFVAAGSEAARMRYPQLDVPVGLARVSRLGDQIQFAGTGAAGAPLRRESFQPAIQIRISISYREALKFAKETFAQKSADRGAWRSGRQGRADQVVDSGDRAGDVRRPRV
jgi:hypothetical protein